MSFDDDALLPKANCAVIAPSADGTPAVPTGSLAPGYRLQDADLAAHVRTQGLGREAVEEDGDGMSIDLEMP